MTRRKFIDNWIDREIRKIKKQAWQDYLAKRRMLGGYVEFGKRQFEENVNFYAETIDDLRREAERAWRKKKTKLEGL